MAQQNGSLLMISLHGYVAGSPELGKPDTGGQVIFVLELAKRFARLGYQVDVMTRQFEDQPAFEPFRDRPDCRGAPPGINFRPETWNGALRIDGRHRRRPRPV